MDITANYTGNFIIFVYSFRYLHKIYIQSVPKKYNPLIKWHVYLCYRVSLNILTAEVCWPFIVTHFLRFYAKIMHWY